MGFWLTILTLLLSVYRNYAQHDYFASISGLEKLLAAEEILLENMELHLKSFDANLALINNLILNIEQDLENVDAKTYENPLSALKAFKRFAVDWIDIENVLLTNSTAAFDEIYSFAENKLPAPVAFEDLDGAAEAISRLQFTYNIKSQDLADGILNGQQTTNPMSADDCFTVAAHMNQVKHFENANEWFFIAKNKVNQSANSETGVFPYLSEDVVLERLVPSLVSSGNLKLAEKLNEKLFQLKPQGVVLDHDNLLKQEFLNERQSSSMEKPWTKPFEEPLYKKVCSGELRQSPREQRNLRCRYVCNKKSYCIISPFKFEEFNLDPFVGYFYDVIYEKEIQVIRNATKTNLVRSTIGLKAERSNIRTSKNTWLDFELHKELRQFARRMLGMTGLDLEYREDLQVANYGIGGHYAPHIDPSDKEDEAESEGVAKHPHSFDIIGNRILTALFYINDVDVGGATAFPFLKISAPPIKGSAVVWYNLHKDLSCDYRTWHAGCPVLSGSKWIVTQWFHTFGQEFLRPCGLKEDQNSSLPFKEKINEQYKLRLS